MNKILATFLAGALLAIQHANAQPQTGPFPVPGGGGTVSFATPAQTAAGTSTTLAVNPYDLAQTILSTNDFIAMLNALYAPIGSVGNSAYSTNSGSAATANVLTGSVYNATAIIGTGTTNTGYLSNTVSSASAGTTIHLLPGTYIGGDEVIRYPVNVSLTGDSPENTTVLLYNTSANGQTNGGGLWLSDNCSLENLYINQTNMEGWPVAPVGAQRKNQLSPVPTPQNLAATSTNVTLRNLTIRGAKTGGVVINCTNTFNWNIINCDVSSSVNEAIAIGLAGTTGDGITPAPIPVVNPFDYVNILNTSVTEFGGGGTTAIGVLVNFSGVAKIQLNNITLTSSGANLGVKVNGTNATVYLSILGTQVYSPSSLNVPLYITGSSNTVYCLSGVTSYVDLGLGNSVYFLSQPNTPSSSVTVDTTMSSTQTVNPVTGQTNYLLAVTNVPSTSITGGITALSTITGIHYVSSLTFSNILTGYMLGTNALNQPVMWAVSTNIISY